MHWVRNKSSIDCYFGNTLLFVVSSHIFSSFKLCIISRSYLTSKIFISFVSFILCVIQHTGSYRIVNSVFFTSLNLLYTIVAGKRDDCLTPLGSKLLNCCFLIFCTLQRICVVKFYVIVTSDIILIIRTEALCFLATYVCNQHTNLCLVSSLYFTCSCSCKNCYSHSSC